MASEAEQIAASNAVRLAGIRPPCCFCGDMCKSAPCPCADNLARAALEAAEKVRESERKANCQHARRNGQYQTSGDGSSKWWWFCSDCGRSDRGETPAREGFNNTASFAR